MILPFGCKTAEKYIPNMKELILSGEKAQTLRLCGCYDSIPMNTFVCRWHKLKPGHNAQLYWKPRAKKQWVFIPKHLLTKLKILDHEFNNVRIASNLFKGTHYMDDLFDFQKDFLANQLLWSDFIDKPLLTDKGIFRFSKRGAYKQVGGSEFLGEPEITETFDITLGKYGEFEKDRPHDSPFHAIVDGLSEWTTGREMLEDLAQKDGFRDDERIPTLFGEVYEPYLGLTAGDKMFLFVDETYGLDVQRRMVVVRWKPLNEANKKEMET